MSTGMDVKNSVDSKVRGTTINITWMVRWQRVFCLTMTAEKLQQLRRVRADEESIPLYPYASLDQIRNELFYVEGLCRKQNWQRVDVTGKSVEEAAREIIEWLEE